MKLKDLQFSNKFQITLNQKIFQSANVQQIEEKQLEDKLKFQVDQFGNILSLKNISILNDVNPLNQIIMLEHMTVNAKISIASNQFDFQINQPVEYYINNYLPKHQINLISMTSKQMFFKVDLVKLISYNISNMNEVLEKISDSVNVPVSSITKFENEKFFFQVNNQLLVDQTGKLKPIIKEYCKNQIQKLIDMETYKQMINFNIIFKVYDNVSRPINESNQLNYQFISCEFNLIDQKQEKQNWILQKKWNNSNKENIIVINLNCAKNFKILKPDFFEKTGIDLDNVKHGWLNFNTFQKFNIQIKQIPPYNRFQYFLRSK